MQMADHMADDGYKDAGYEYINIDVRYTAYILYSNMVYIYCMHNVLGRL